VGEFRPSPVVVNSNQFSRMAIASERGKLIFRKMVRDLHRISRDLHPDSVHAFRTTSLRLQTLLEELLPERKRSQKKLLALLTRIRKKAGKVRDFDVQLAALRSLKTGQEPRRKTQLTQGLIELRAKHEKKLGKLLKKNEVRDIEKRLRKIAKDFDFKTAHDPLVLARRIVKSVGNSSATPDEAALHRCRLAVKRARYAAELASPSRESAELIAHLKKLQDALGHWHDWLMLTHTAVDRLGEVNHSSLVAALQNVTRGKLRQAIATLPSTPPGLPSKVASGAHPVRNEKFAA
jgi:CHAD domain-containing protein